MEKISLTVADIVSGNYTPHLGLNSSDFEFVLASDNVTPVTFSSFTDSGNGNYEFSGFSITSGNPHATGYDPAYPFGYRQVKVKIGGTLQPSYGIITIYADDDEPVSLSYSTGRVDRDGDTAYFWFTYDHANWLGTNSYDPNTAPFPDDVLVPNKYIKDNFATLNAINSTFPLNNNRLLVDSKVPANITGKVYQNISGAIAYITGLGTPTSSNRWQILVLPSHTGQYIDNFYWYDYIDIIGLGWVKITNTPNYSLFIRSGSFTDYNCRAVNLQFQQTDQNLEAKLMLMQNSSFVMIEDNYAPVLTLTQSQFIDCDFGGIGGYSVVTGHNNSVYNCHGGYNVTWHGSDDTYNWAYISGKYMRQ